MLRKITVFVLILFALLTPSVCEANVSIQELSNLGFSGYESTNTDSPEYLIKRFQEELILRFFKRDQKSKIDYLAVLLDKRYKEVVYVASKDQTGVFENTVRRFETTAGKLLAQPQAITPTMKTQAAGYLKVLARVRDNYPANSAYWIMIQESIDTTRRLL